MHSLLAAPFVLLLLLLTPTAASFTPHDIGDRLFYSYNKFHALPTTADAAKSSGWYVNTSCTPHYGYAATRNPDAAISQKQPMVLYFNGAGQVNGMGMLIFASAVSPLLVQRGFLQPVAKGMYGLRLVFRAEDPCASSPSPFPLGDRLLVHPDTINYSLPVVEREAAAADWTKGSCFADMGYHYFFDLVGAPAMTWKSNNMLPISLMFNEGVINAFFFASNVVQQDVLALDPHMWDVAPLINFLMCKNWCNSSCTFTDSSTWSTGHIFLRDYTKATCAGGCTIGCCP